MATAYDVWTTTPGSGTVGSQASEQRSVGTSGRTAKFLGPDVGGRVDQMGRLQEGIGLSDLQGQAVGEQDALGRRLTDMLDEQQLSSASRRGAGFTNAMDAERARLGARGTLADDALMQASDSAMNREAALQMGMAGDRASDVALQNRKQTTNKLSELLLGSSGQSMDILKSLLGAGGIGYDSEQLAASRGQTGSQQAGEQVLGTQRIISREVGDPYY